MINEQKRVFWDSRSDLGETAGSNDFILKRIETQLISQRVPRGSGVLDVGCGNGDTLIHLALQNACDGIGVDFAPRMIAAARASCAAQNLDRRLRFEQSHIPGLRRDLGQFDVVLTQRCLVNLDDVGAQHQAFSEIMTCVKPGGIYLMIEDSHDGLEKLNAMRRLVELEPIPPPWHNVFLHERDVAAWATDEWRIEDFVPFTSTYYFLSRVVYARLARDTGEELRYDSAINLMAPKFPPMGDLGAVRLWVWRKERQ